MTKIQDAYERLAEVKSHIINADTNDIEQYWESQLPDAETAYYAALQEATQ